jgi:type I restriction enzyme R subunit
MDAPQRISKIVDYIIANHGRKTHSKDFNAILCVSSVEVLTKYYEIFKQKKQTGEHNLRIATIFSYTANEDNAEANGIIPEDTIEVD